MVNLFQSVKNLFQLLLTTTDFYSKINLNTVDLFIHVSFAIINGIETFVWETSIL